MLRDPLVDIVYVSLPDSLHIEWAHKAIQSGKHVLCEKPISRRFAAVADVFDSAERAGLLLMEAFMYRHHPQTQRLEALVNDGAVGSIVCIHEWFTVPLSDPTNIRLRRELDGGSLAGIGCYCVSTARQLAGEPERVYGEQVVGETGVDVRFHGVMRFPGDVVAHFDVGLGLPTRHGLHLTGTEGSIVVRDPWLCRQPLIEITRDERTTQHEFKAVSSYELQISHVGSALRGETPALFGREDAVGQARTIEALYESANSGAAVVL